jgi:hypothetical protein
MRRSPVLNLPPQLVFPALPDSTHRVGCVSPEGAYSDQHGAGSATAVKKVKKNKRRPRQVIS